MEPPASVTRSCTRRVMADDVAVFIETVARIPRLVAALAGLSRLADDFAQVDEPFVEQLQAPRPPTEDNPEGRAVLTRTLQHIDDVDADLSWGDRFREHARLRGFRALLVVPMLRGDAVVGVLAASRSRPGAFTPSEIALARTFASQAVIAIENARVLHELQARNADLAEALEQQTATAEILRVISRS